MYFCYIDESGDTGEYLSENPEKSGSHFFILAGLIVPSKNWKSSLDVLKSYRRRIAAQGLLAYDIEFHCSELIDPHKIKAYTQISISERWKLIEEFAETIGQQGAFTIITIIIDKSKSKLDTTSYLTESITKLYRALDEYLKIKNENGLVFFDRARASYITSHVRRLMGTGSSGITIPGIRIGWIIEDPIFRISSDSIFIQAADVIAYSLKEKEFPQGSRKKFNADKIFTKRLISRGFISTLSEDDGIIRV